jgi:hypothetical protein
MQEMIKNFRPIITDSISLRKKGGYFFGSPLFYSLLAAPALLFAFFIVYRKKQEELAGNTTLAQSLQANKLANKRLAEAANHLKAGNQVLFYEEILKGLWGYISGKLGIPLAALSKESAIAALQQKNTPDELIQKLTATIDTCEFARYAPAGNLAAMENVYEDAVYIITQLEKHLKR